MLFQRHGIGRLCADASMPWTATTAGIGSECLPAVDRSQSAFYQRQRSAGLEAAYQRDEDDEFVQATVIQGEGVAPALIDDGDVVLFMNLGADGPADPTLVDDDFEGFERAFGPAG